MLAFLPDTMTTLPEDRSLFTNGKKSLFDLSMITLDNLKQAAGPRHIIRINTDVQLASGGGMEPLRVSAPHSTTQ